MPREPKVRGKWITASEYKRRQMLTEIDAEVKVEKEPDRARPERPPANGVYRGTARVRVLPPGLALSPDDPGQLGISKGTFARSRRR